MPKAIDVDWSKVQLRYMTGQLSCREVAEEFGISPFAVQRRAVRENWNDQKQHVVQEVSKKTVEKLVDRRLARIQEHHSLVIPIAEKLISGVEKAYDWTKDNPEGLEPPQLQGLAMALKTANQVALLNLGFVEQKAVDVTSGGLSMHENALALLQECRKLHEAGQLKPETIDVDGLVKELKDSETQNS